MKFTVSLRKDDRFEYSEDWGVPQIRCGDLIIAGGSEATWDSLHTVLFALEREQEFQRLGVRDECDPHANEGARHGEDA